MMNDESGIYLITNTMNGKQYVGSSVNMKKRFQLHRSRLNNAKHHSLHLQRAWNKYGADAFKFERIHSCEKEHLIYFENYYIGAFKPEYNIAQSAGNCLGVIPTEKTRRKMSEVRKKLALDPEWRRKNKLQNQKINKAILADAERRNKRTELHKKIASDPKWREKVSIGTKKQAHKIGEANKRRIWTEESRRKLSEANKGNQRARKKM